MPAYIQAVNSQITNNVATSQGGGINAATSDAIVLVGTELSGNFGESLAYPPCVACKGRCRTLLLQATDDICIFVLCKAWRHKSQIQEAVLAAPSGANNPHADLS